MPEQSRYMIFVKNMNLSLILLNFPVFILLPKKSISINSFSWWNWIVSNYFLALFCCFVFTVGLDCLQLSPFPSIISFTCLENHPLFFFPVFIYSNFPLVSFRVLMTWLDCLNPTTPFFLPSKFPFLLGHEKQFAFSFLPFISILIKL